MKDKIKVSLDRDLVQVLLNRKKLGETYSQILRRLLEEKGWI